MESSDPSETTSTISDDEAPIDVDIDIIDPKPIKADRPKKKSKSHPLIFSILLDFLVPLAIAAIILSTLQLIGLLFSLVLMFHVLLLKIERCTPNRVQKMLMLEIFLMILVCIVSLVSYSFESDSEFSRISGYAQICENPTLIFVLTLLSLILISVTYLILSKTPPSDYTPVRTQILSSTIYELIIDFIWSICVSFHAATNFSYLFVPILIYFAYVAVTYPLTGRSLCPRWISQFVCGLALINSLYTLYQTSYLGGLYSLAEPLGFIVLHGLSIQKILIYTCVLSLFASSSMMTVAGFASTKPKITLPFISILAKLTGLGIVAYAVAYSHWMSAFWALLAALTVFYPSSLRATSVIYSLSFIAIAITSYDIIPNPNIEILTKIGFFKYISSGPMLVVGFLLSSVLSQLSKHSQSQETLQPFKWISYVLAVFRVLLPAIAVTVSLALPYNKDSKALWIIGGITALTIFGVHRIIFVITAALSGLLIPAAIVFSKVGMFETELKNAGWSLFAIFAFTSLSLKLVQPVSETRSNGLETVMSWLSTSLVIVDLMLYRWTLLTPATIVFAITAFSLQLLSLSKTYHVCAFILRVLLIADILFETVPSILEIPSQGETSKIRIFVVALAVYSSAVSGVLKSSSSGRTLAINVIEMLKGVFRTGYFYVAWALLYGFSVSAHTPTAIKFLLMLPFLIGPRLAPLIIRLQPLVLFLTLAALAAGIVGDVIEISKLSDYIGLTLSFPSRVPAGWLVAVSLCTAINLAAMKPLPQDEDFEKKALVKILGAIVAGIHHALPVVVEGFLCYATLKNPSVFGMLSLALMTIITYYPNVLATSGKPIAAFANLSLMVQYLCYLGPYPHDLFRVSQLENDWGRFLGVYDISVNALTANFIACFALAIYRQFGNFFVDYGTAVSSLPHWATLVLNFLITYSFELLIAIAICILSSINTIDAVLMSLMAIVLFGRTLLAGLIPSRILNPLTAGVICVVSTRTLSRIPVFESEGPAKYVAIAFGLPFRGEGKAAGWTAVFVLIRLAQHISLSNLGQLCSEGRCKRSAYRFLRSRVLRILERENQIVIRDRKPPEPDYSPCAFPPWTTVLMDGFVSSCARTMPINREAGMNFLTLQSLLTIFEKQKTAIKLNRQLVLTAKDTELLAAMPPSIFYQLSSLRDLIDRKQGKSDVWRYITAMVRNCSLPITSIISAFVFIFRPSIPSALLMISLFFPASLTRLIYWASSLLILLRATSLLAILSEPLTTVARVAESTLSIFGLQPTKSLWPEAFVYFWVSYLAADRESHAEIRTPSYYKNLFSLLLPGFPHDYCYGLLSNPEKTLALDAPYPREGKGKGLIRNLSPAPVLIVEVISGIVLAFGFSSWIGSRSGTVEGSTVSSSGSLYTVLSVAVHILFAVCALFLQVSERFRVLFWLNLTQLSLTLVLGFLGKYGGLLGVFVASRMIASWLLHRRVVSGVKFVGSVMPDFNADGAMMRIKNMFIRTCPFVFEIDSLMHWMKQPTAVSFSDFMVVRDAKTRAEKRILTPQEEREATSRLVIGSIALFAVILVLIAPLLLIASGVVGSTKNPLISAEVHIGFQGFGEIWRSDGVIRLATNAQRDSVADVVGPSLVLAPDESVYIVEFPSMSEGYFERPELDLLLSQFVVNTTSKVYPYVAVTLGFEHLTTDESTRLIEYTKVFDPLSDVDKEAIYAAYNGGTPFICPFKSPSALFVPSGGPITVKFDGSGVPSIAFNTDTTTTRKYTSLSYTGTSPQLISVIPSSSSSHPMIVWSQPVVGGDLVSSLYTAGGGIVGIYVLILITLGSVIRGYSFGLLDDLWLRRMEDPKRLYKKIIDIESYRAALDPEQELKATEDLLDILRSREKILELTKKE